MAKRRAKKKTTKVAITPSAPTDLRDDHPDPPKLSCCPPRVLVWTDAISEAIFVENRVSETRHFQVQAGVAQTAMPQAQLQDSASDSKLDTTTSKDQGKVYRTDRYTIHWRAEAACAPIAVRLTTTGAVDYRGDCIPQDGQLTLSRTYIMEPPYMPVGPDHLAATVEVWDYAGQHATCTNRVPRP